MYGLTLEQIGNCKPSPRTVTVTTGGVLLATRETRRLVLAIGSPGASVLNICFREEDLGTNGLPLASGLAPLVFNFCDHPGIVSGRVYGWVVLGPENVHVVEVMTPP